MNKYIKFLNSISTKYATILYNEDLKKHCSFRIGGKAKFFIIVNNEKTLLNILKLNNKKILIIGAGTNILFRNKKFNGTFIKLGEAFNKIKTASSKKKYKIIEVGAGTNLFKLNLFLRKHGLSGLEWSFGIPGTVGGAIKMNAGAYGHEFGELVESVKVFSKGKIFWTKDFSFSYRSSSFKDCIILSVKLKLSLGKTTNIEIAQKEYLSRRKESQPYSDFSAGSVFKRIINKEEIIYPAKIIDNLGLKGVKIGDAEISTKHAGFIINKGNAKSKDVVNLIRFIKKMVKKKTKQDLQEEIIIF